MKPVIVHIIQHLKPGGIEILVIEMLKRNKRFDFHIIALEGNIEDALLQFPVLANYQNKIHCLGKSPGIQWRTVTSLRSMLKRLMPVACITHHIGPLFYATLAKSRLGIEHFHTEHDAWHLNDPSHERLQYWCLKMAQPTVIADAKVVAEILSAKFQFIVPHLIHNGIDTERFKPGSKKEARKQLALPENKRLLDCAARLEPIKQIHRLINALKVLPCDVHLVIAGKGSEYLPLLRQAARLNLSDRIHFLGFQKNPEIFYQAIDVFCLVSKNEGFPLSSIEAQACNVPVVLTDVGGCRETVCPSSGMLLIRDDHTQLVNTIKCQLHRAHFAQPRSFIKHRFSIETMLRNYELIIEQSLILEEAC